MLTNYKSYGINGVPPNTFKAMYGGNLNYFVNFIIDLCHEVKEYSE